MILASILIGPPGRGEDLALPPMVQQNIASLKRHHPGLPHRLFSGEDITGFLEEKFPREVTAAYNAMRPYAYKADLARYCILYELGGIYADLSLFFLRSLPSEGERPVVFRDLLGSAPWDTNNGLFAVPARHKVLELAIERVCANVKQRYYGPTPLSPTGPAVFGKAIAMACEAEDLTTGLSLTVPRERLHEMYPRLALPKVQRLHCFALLENQLLAVKRKRRGAAGLGELGIIGGSDYSGSWKRREVYDGETAAAAPPADR